MNIISEKYPGLPVERRLLLFGVKIESLEDYASILKSDEELTLKEFKKLFKFDEDGYPEKEVENAFYLVAPIKPEEIFSERFSNVEVRAAILRYVSPDKVFKALNGQVVDVLKVKKKYPRYFIKGRPGKPDSSRVESADLTMEMVEREEEYELIEITDKKIIGFLPWGQKAIYLLKMLCPSSKKTYYEYIDVKVIEEASEHVIKRILKRRGSNSGRLVRAALCWQMTKSNGKPLTEKQYYKMYSET